MSIKYHPETNVGIEIEICVENNVMNVAIISGVGVRQFYEKKGGYTRSSSTEISPHHGTFR